MDSHDKPEPQKPQATPLRAYLGDGVYIEFDGFLLLLTTEDGIRATNTIVLEPDVWLALKAYVARLEADAKGGAR